MEKNNNFPLNLNNCDRIELWSQVISSNFISEKKNTDIDLRWKIKRTHRRGFSLFITELEVHFERIKKEEIESIYRCSLPYKVSYWHRTIGYRFSLEFHVIILRNSTHLPLKWNSVFFSRILGSYLMWNWRESSEEFHNFQ